MTSTLTSKQYEAGLRLRGLPADYKRPIKEGEPRSAKELEHQKIGQQLRAQAVFAPKSSNSALDEYLSDMKEKGVTFEVQEVPRRELKGD